jgi:serine/threonine-protein kinase RsbW
MRDETIRMEIPATFRRLSLISGCIVNLLERTADLPQPELVTYHVQLAVQEIGANIVEHAYRDMQRETIRVILNLTSQPRRLQIELFDNGRAFEPDLVKVPDLDNPEVGGYGMFLVRQLMDEVYYERRQDHNYWRLIKYLEPA